MQSASPDRVLNLRGMPGAAWERTRHAVPASTLWSALLVFLLTVTFARSTVTASWVGGIEIVVVVALAGAAVMGMLAVTPVSWIWAVSAGLALGPLVAVAASASAFKAGHPFDPAGLPLLKVWLGRIQDGSAFSDSAFVLFLIAWLMWVAGAWLSWSVLRWRQPLIGLVPGAAAFATNVLNAPQDQNSYTLLFLVLTFALLLWTNYTGSIARATAARVKLTADARWDFWESGLVAMAALILLGVLLPPLSTIDRTATMQSNLFTSWAQLQQELNHPSNPSDNPGGVGVGTTGFSPVVGLSGPLHKSAAIVFTYRVTGSYPGPRYFRGLSVTQTVDGEWRVPATPGVQERISKGGVPVTSEQDSTLALATFDVNMQLPPVGFVDLLFYPGQLYHVDRTTIASQEVIPPFFVLTPAGWQNVVAVPGAQLVSIDKLSSVSPPRSTGTYNVTVAYPDATDTQLRSAGTDYPQWLQPYMVLPTQTYRPPDVLKRIHDEAVSLTAGLTNPYDMATAIQNYLRSSVFRYTLAPSQAPPDADKLDYFLFTSHEGYCEYFATAMGDMLRSLGIPTRLVSGYGPGSYDASKNLYVVRGEDAHTWVESYFPHYGWIPFEPTASGYNAINRGTSGTNLCLRDNNCDNPSPNPGVTKSNLNPGKTGVPDPGVGGPGPGGLRFQLPDASTMTKLIGVLLALALVLAALAARYLRPRTVMGVWRRTHALARLAGAQAQPGETPLELGRRLARIFPEVEGPVRALAGAFVVAAYAPSEAAQGTRATVMEAWAALRPLMLRRVMARLRPSRA